MSKAFVSLLASFALLAGAAPAAMAADSGDQTKESANKAAEKESYGKQAGAIAKDGGAGLTGTQWALIGGGGAILIGAAAGGGKGGGSGTNTTGTTR